MPNYKANRTYVHFVLIQNEPKNQDKITLQPALKKTEFSNKQDYLL